MGGAMKGVTKAMGQMNRQMKLPALQKIMQEFEMQNEKMAMTAKIMGDAIDNALEGDEEEEETEELVNQVLDEIEIDINQEYQDLSSKERSKLTNVGNAEEVEETTTTDQTSTSEPMSGGKPGTQTSQASNCVLKRRFRVRGKSTDKLNRKKSHYEKHRARETMSVTQQTNLHDAKSISKAQRWIGSFPE